MSDRPNQDGSSNYERIDTSQTWNNQIIESCAHFLRKSVSELNDEYQDKFISSNNAFPDHSAELLPRDFADFVIISALKANLSLKKKNLCAWYFNLMDRNGSGYVQKEEFVRYSPYMSPVSDGAMSGTIFSILLATQEQSDHNSARQCLNSQNCEPVTTGSSSEQLCGTDSSPLEHTTNVMLHTRRRKILRRNNGGNDSSSCEGSPKSATVAYNLLPSGNALLFETWQKYYESVLENYAIDDPEWSKVKEEVGIDPDEVLIKSENAVAHVDFLPSLGKIYLSQRYLIFHAAIGINHYVARLGAVIDVRKSSIPFLLRDVFEVFLASETQAAIQGITSSNYVTPRESHRKRKQSIPEHIEKIMKKFTSGVKPLVLSLLEVGDSAKRDEWVTIIQEIVCGHELHRRMGFGNSGRVSFAFQHRLETEDEISIEARRAELARSRQRRSKSIDDVYSPFLNEPLTPLLVIAAHVNVARYKSFECELVRSNPHRLLIFSHPQLHKSKIKWFVDSVQKHDGWTERSWIKRVLSSVRENIDTNERLYNAHDFEPVSIPVLTTNIGRLAELCSPLANFVQNCNYLFQWRNPSATILAILSCIFISTRELIVYIPSMVVFSLILCVIETRFSIIGLYEQGSSAEEAREQRENVFQMVAQVQDALQAAQNVILYVNKHLGKVQTLFLWRCDYRKSWIALMFLAATTVVLSMFSAKLLFMTCVFFMFGKHFLPPSNPVLRFWESVPSNLDPS